MMNAALPPPAVINSERRDMSLLYPLADDSFRRTSAINGIGWVGGAASVQSVDLLLDGVPVGRAILGLASSDLAGLANDAPDAAGVGFVFSIPAALAQCDTPTLEVRATTTAGTEALHVRLTIIAGDEATFLPSWHVPRPAPRYLVAYPDRPLRDARRTDLAEDQQSLEWVWRLEPIESAGPKDLAAAYRATDAVRLMCEEAVLFEDGQLAVKGLRAIRCSLPAIRSRMPG